MSKVSSTVTSSINLTFTLNFFTRCAIKTSLELVHILFWEAPILLPTTILLVTQMTTITVWQLEFRVKEQQLTDGVKMAKDMTHQKATLIGRIRYTGINLHW